MVISIQYDFNNFFPKHQDNPELKTSKWSIEVRDKTVFLNMMRTTMVGVTTRSKETVSIINPHLPFALTKRSASTGCTRPSFPGLCSNLSKAGYWSDFRLSNVSFPSRLTLQPLLSYLPSSSFFSVINFFCVVSFWQESVKKMASPR